MKNQGVTARQLAQALGVHTRTVDKFVSDGMPVAKRGRGGRPSRYDLDECQAWKAAREAAAAQDGPVDLARERARKERAQALLAEQLYDVRSRKLVAVEDVEKAWTAEITAARAVILASYTAAADRVYRAGVQDGLGGVERELKGLAYEVLRELSQPTVASSTKKPKKKPRRRAA